MIPFISGAYFTIANISDENTCSTDKVSCISKLFYVIPIFRCFSSGGFLLASVFIPSLPAWRPRRRRNIFFRCRISAGVYITLIYSRVRPNCGEPGFFGVREWAVRVANIVSKCYFCPKCHPMKRDSQFKLSYFLSANEVFHIARVNITSSQDLSLHTHDYAEILWIEKGTGYHHVNGRQVRLSAGDMVMIRPRDCHTFRRRGAGSPWSTSHSRPKRLIFCAAAISGTATSISGAPRCCLSISNSRRISSKDSLREPKRR